MSEGVYITRLSAYLPNEGISNDEMEEYLGLIDNESSKAKGLVLRNNKIKNRFYALDKNGEITHTNAEITANAIRSLMDESFSLENIELLACGTTSPDQLLPSHASMVHGLLKCKPVEIISTNGACNSGMHAFKYSYLSVKSGNTTNAVSAGSERMSVFLLSRNFKFEAENLKKLNRNPVIAFEKDFLRFMLSDGAGAVLMQNTPNSEAFSLKIEWVEIMSFANELETCMYCGAEKREDGELTGWLDHDSAKWMSKSLFSIKQDVKLLSNNIVNKGMDALNMVLEKNGLDMSTVDFFLPHISSEYFRMRIQKRMEDIGINMPQEKWFLNLSTVGNVGAASAYLMLEELYKSGKLKKNNKILLMVLESARFSYTYVLLTVV